MPYHFHCLLDLADASAPISHTTATQYDQLPTRQAEGPLVQLFRTAWPRPHDWSCGEISIFTVGLVSTRANDHPSRCCRATARSARRPRPLDVDTFADAMGSAVWPFAWPMTTTRP